MSVIIVVSELSWILNLCYSKISVKLPIYLLIINWLDLIKI